MKTNGYAPNRGSSSLPTILILAPALVLCLFSIPLAKAQDAYEPDNTAADAKVISNGQTQNRSIHQAGNVDWAKLTIGASGASNVRIETDGATGDTEMWLYGPNSSTIQLAYDDDNGNSTFSLIARASLAAGTYYIKVTEYGNNGTIGAYTLKASWLWAERFTKTGTATLNGAQRDSITLGGGQTPELLTLGGWQMSAFSLRAGCGWRSVALGGSRGTRTPMH